MRIYRKTASAHGLTLEEYVATFVHRGGDWIILAADEEGDAYIALDVIAAEFLAHELLSMAEEIRRERQQRRTASSHD